MLIRSQEKPQKALAKHFEVTLMFCFEKKGVLKDENDDESVIPEIDRTAFEQYVEAGVIQGGMIPKLEKFVSGDRCRG